MCSCPYLTEKVLASTNLLAVTVRSKICVYAPALYTLLVGHSDHMIGSRSTLTIELLLLDEKCVLGISLIHIV